jgi:hypothetical protein
MCLSFKSVSKRYKLQIHFRQRLQVAGSPGELHHCHTPKANNLAFLLLLLLNTKKSQKKNAGRKKERKKEQQLNATPLVIASFSGSTHSRVNGTDAICKREIGSRTSSSTWRMVKNLSAAPRRCEAPPMIALASTTRVRRPLRDLTVSVATLGGTGTASFLATADHPTGAEATIGAVVEVTEGLVEIATSASMTSYLLRSAKQQRHRCPQTDYGKILRENLQNDPQTPNPNPNFC